MLQKCSPARKGNDCQPRRKSSSWDGQKRETDGSAPLYSRLEWWRLQGCSSCNSFKSNNGDNGLQLAWSEMTARKERRGQQRRKKEEKEKGKEEVMGDEAENGAEWGWWWSKLSKGRRMRRIQTGEEHMTSPKLRERDKERIGNGAKTWYK